MQEKELHLSSSSVSSFSLIDTDTDTDTTSSASTNVKPSISQSKPTLSPVFDLKAARRRISGHGALPLSNKKKLSPQVIQLIQSQATESKIGTNDSPSIGATPFLRRPLELSSSFHLQDVRRRVSEHALPLMNKNNLSQSTIQLIQSQAIESREAIVFRKSCYYPQQFSNRKQLLELKSQKCSFFRSNSV
eukprot:8748_1